MRAWLDTSSDLEAEAAKFRDQARRIEGGMNGIAGPRMIEREVKQRLGRHAGAGAAEPDARRRQSRRSRSERDGGAGTVIAGYSAGTEASRSRIE